MTSLIESRPRAHYAEGSVAVALPHLVAETLLASPGLTPALRGRLAEALAPSVETIETATEPRIVSLNLDPSLASELASVSESIASRCDPFRALAAELHLASFGPSFEEAERYVAEAFAGL